METTGFIVFKFSTFWEPIKHDIISLDPAKIFAVSQAEEGHPTKVENTRGTLLFYLG
jgi:hypothetical protein